MWTCIINHLEKIMPTIIIVCGIGSVLIYTYKGMIGHSLYWISASMLTYTVTYLMR